MKKVLSVLLIAVIMAAAAVSCKKSSSNSTGPGPSSPAGTSTPTVTTVVPASDNSMYGFEDGTAMSWKTGLGGVTNTANSTAKAYLGTHSLRVDGVFTNSGSNSAIIDPLSAINMSGKKLIARVYLPAGVSGGGCIYIQSGSGWCWSQGTWANMTGGKWNELTMDVDNPSWKDSTCTCDPTIVNRLGITFKPGSNYTGSIYFDTIEIVSAGTPTSTPTISQTATISPTGTDTITPGGPTQTITPTYTISPTITYTLTPINTPISPGDSSYQYYGRWNTSNSSDAKNGWGTTYVTAGFSGTTVIINLSAWDSWYAYAIDSDISDHTKFTKFRVRNQSDQQTPVSTQTPLVITGLADTTHTIMVVRRTEGTGGVNDFYGFSLDNGKTLSSPGTRTTRKIEIIGDSIACGAKDEYASAIPTPDCIYGGCIQNGDMAFGPQLARLCGAEWRTISRGGIGMYTNCSGCTPDYTMPQIYPYMYYQSDPTGLTPDWNFSSWQADVVLVELGTNDFSYGVTQDHFVSTYITFLKTLRTDYPSAYILCTQPVPPGVNINAGIYINEAVTSTADAKIYYVPNTLTLTAGDFADDNTHPLVAVHTEIANMYHNWIQTNIPGLGW